MLYFLFDIKVNVEKALPSFLNEVECGLTLAIVDAGLAKKGMAILHCTHFLLYLCVLQIRDAPHRQRTRVQLPK